jgi:hypothetical protein
MSGRRTKKWLVALGVAGVVLALLAACGVVGWRAVQRYFVRQYYQQEYRPMPLEAEGTGPFPDEHHLDDVPWFATAQPLCQSNSLQMMAAQHGIERPRRYFDFLMGFTYGVAQIPGGLGFFPGTDPESGFVAAAPYLGLDRRYYTTDGEALYLDTLRSFLAQGYAVRVGLDMGVLYGVEEEMPHSELLVGYDQGGFHYYETVCAPPARCEPGQQPAGESGLYVPDERLLDAVSGQAQEFDYPWRYALMIFEPGPLEEDLGAIWARNGRSLVGGVRYGPKQGADVLDALADEIEVRGSRLDPEEMRSGLEVAVYVRQENATLMREMFPGEADLERAAVLFERASGDYQAVLAALEGGIGGQEEAGQAAAALRDAAAAEREAGEIFLARRQ